MAIILAGIHSLTQHLQQLNSNPEAYRPKRCPHCGHAGVWSHGHYLRLPDRENSGPDSLNPIPILRFFCPQAGCRRSCSALPECIPPRRWYLWSVQQAMLLFLISLAMADQNLDVAEHNALRRIAALLGYGADRLEQLLRMAQAQEHCHSGESFAAQPGTSLEDAYTALGVTRDVSNRELKQAYRRRMSENHPDKLMAKGVPEHMVKLATERSQEIQAAYEMIRKTRPEMR